jgi:hypothetical protein
MDVSCREDKRCFIPIKLLTNTSSIDQDALIDTGTYLNFVFDSFGDTCAGTGKYVDYSILGNSGKEEIRKCKIEIAELNWGEDFYFVKPSFSISGLTVLLGTAFLEAYVFCFNSPKKGMFSLNRLSASGQE